ncbi:DUF898 family protein [Egicoccus sp. AB-alg2]|uniref:DUF898 family protein n=1 Tax=Egicoccus sp. AB-alg2 TaxID=3242693 RepID=UPI00359CF78E
MGRSTTFRFDGGAGTYLGTGILAFLVIVCTLGIATPFAIVLQQRWRAKHTYVNGHRLIFLGTGTGLFGHWLKWFALTVITLGVYSFWVIPRVHRWIVENTDFDPAFTSGPAFQGGTSVVGHLGGATPAPLQASDRPAIPSTDV